MFCFVVSEIWCYRVLAALLSSDLPHSTCVVAMLSGVAVSAWPWGQTVGR